MILRQEARRQRLRSRTTRCMIEVQNEVMLKKADPQRVKEHSQLQETSTKRARDDEVTHAQRCAPAENKIKFFTAEAPEELTVSSSTHVSTEHCGDPTDAALEQQL